MGSYHPNNIITNEFLEDLGIESSAQWIIDKIGIKERKTVLPLDYIKDTKNADPRKALELVDTNPAKMGASAAEIAAKKAGISLSEIGLVITNCCAPRYLFPTTSQSICQELGILAPAYEVFSACPAFALHMDYLSYFQEAKLPEYILCVSTAMLTQKVDYSDRSASAIWGDGAAAWIVSTKHEGPLTVSAASFDSDPLRCAAVVIDTFGHFHQNGRAVRDFSVRQTVRMVKALEREYQLDWSKDIFIGHQANATMLEQIRNNRKIPHENHWHNVTYIGNQAGAGAPAVLAANWDKLKANQRILVAVVGAGLSWGTVLLEARSKVAA